MEEQKNASNGSLHGHESLYRLLASELSPQLFQVPVCISRYYNSGFPYEQWVLDDSARRWISSQLGLCAWQEVSRVLYGCNRGRVVTPVALKDDDKSKQDNFDLQVRLYLNLPVKLPETRIGTNQRFLWVC